MPFYLVTQTTLIEAESDSMAAQKAVDKVRTANLVKVVVKIDDTMTTHVIEPGGRTVERLTASVMHMREDNPKPTVVEERAGNASLLKRFSHWLTSRPTSR